MSTPSPRSHSRFRAVATALRAASRPARRTEPRHHGRAPRRGLTLVETIVAIALFTGALLALTASSAVALRLLGDARRQTSAVAAARTRLERQLATPCPFALADTSDTSAPFPRPPVRIVVDSLELPSRIGARVIPLAAAAPC